MLFIIAKYYAKSTECGLKPKYIISFINSAIPQPSMGVPGFVRAVLRFILAFIHESALICAV
jgi:hypothetical protein